MLTKFTRSSILALAFGVLLLGGCQSAGRKVPEGPFRSELHVLDELGPGASGELVATGPIVADALTVFSEALVSMNAEVPAGAGVRLGGVVYLHWRVAGAGVRRKNGLGL
jgi:hypothetical protein